MPTTTHKRVECLLLLCPFILKQSRIYVLYLDSTGTAVSPLMVADFECFTIFFGVTSFNCFESMKIINNGLIMIEE